MKCHFASCKNEATQFCSVCHQPICGYHCHYGMCVLKVRDKGKIITRPKHIRRVK